jgi:hypothetical protein
MYCSRCGGQLHYKNLDNAGWCEHCASVVNVWPCKVPFWNVMAVIMMAWMAQVGI